MLLLIIDNENIIILFNNKILMRNRQTAMGLFWFSNILLRTFIQILHHELDITQFLN